MNENTDTKRLRLVSNERAKLSATFLNNVAVAVIGSGLIAPFFVILYGLGNLTAEQIRFFGLAAPGWVIWVWVFICWRGLHSEDSRNDLA